LLLLLSSSGWSSGLLLFLSSLSLLLLLGLGLGYHLRASCPADARVSALVGSRALKTVAHVAVGTGARALLSRTLLLLVTHHLLHLLDTVRTLARVRVCLSLLASLLLGLSLGLLLLLVAGALLLLLRAAVHGVRRRARLGAISG
jgi:hypothetical protein